MPSKPLVLSRNVDSFSGRCWYCRRMRTEAEMRTEMPHVVVRLSMCSECFLRTDHAPSKAGGRPKGRQDSYQRVQPKRKAS